MQWISGNAAASGARACESRSRRFVSALEAAVTAAAAQNDNKRKVIEVARCKCDAPHAAVITCCQVRIQQVLARLMLDTERYDSSGWKMLDKSESEAARHQVGSVAAPALENDDAALAKIAAAAEAQAQATQQSKSTVEVELLSSISATLATSIAAATASERALTQAIQFLKDLTEASKSQAPPSPVAAAPVRASPAAATAPTAARKEALSLSEPSAPKASSLLSLAEDDSAFDETVTPDAPMLKYGRNGVPELRQVGAALLLQPGLAFGT